MRTHKFNYIYKTTNLINNKFYIGRHSTNNLKDGYLGSGQVLTNSIKKNGKNNFKCEILEYCDSLSILKEREEYYIEKFNAVELGYNLVSNSCGGKLNSKKYGDRFKELITCPHCSKSSHNLGMMHNRRFDNCIKNPDIDIESLKEKKRIEAEKYIKTYQSKPKLKCNWCGKESRNLGVMNKFHFENCKSNPNYIDKRPDIICPHCGKVGKSNMMYKFHFDNCKLSPLFSVEKLNSRKKSPQTVEKIKRLKSTVENREKCRIQARNHFHKNIANKTTLHKCQYCGLESYDSANMNVWHFEKCKFNPESERGKLRIKKEEELARSNKVLLKCPHCNKEGSGSAMKRWHFDNCRFK